MAEKKYKFSVIIPCYKLGALLRNAVDSVASQTLDSVQIIIVDDKSPDKDTRDILKQLEKHVTVIYRDKNGGASAARNTGVKAALSDYILCLDADDTISDTYLEEAYNMFEADAEAGVVAPYTKMVGERTGEWRLDPEKVSIPYALISSPIPNASCFRKKAWSSVDGYDEQLRGMEDWDFWIGILGKGWKVSVLHHAHYLYNNRPGSKVKTSNKNARHIVSYITTKHSKLYAKHMKYVVSETHQKYVDARSRVIELEQELRMQPAFLRLTTKFIKKMRTAVELIFVNRDWKETKKRAAQHLKK